MVTETLRVWNRNEWN